MQKKSTMNKISKFKQRQAVDRVFHGPVMETVLSNQTMVFEPSQVLSVHWASFRQLTMVCK